MTFLLGIARCCCFCEDCCDGSAPANFEVEVSFVDDTCDECDDYLSGAYQLARQGTSCFWYYHEETPEADEPCGDAGYLSTRVVVYLSIICSSATEYTLTLTLMQGFSKEPAPDPCEALWGGYGQQFANIYTWSAVVAASFNCATAFQTLTYQGRECQCTAATNWFGVECESPVWACDEPGNVVVEALA